MASKQEIVEALKRVEERLEALAPRILAGLERPLPTGTWKVHDAICHLAADARGVPAFVERMKRVEQGLPRRDPGFDLDAYNEQQIALRRGKPPEDVLREAREGLQADMQSVLELDEAFLQKELPGVRGDVSPVSDQMRAYLGGHPMRHLDEIEQALQG